MVLFSGLILILILTSFSNLYTKYLEISKFEKPIFSLGIIIILLNFFYFNIGQSVNFILICIVVITVISFSFTFKNFKKYKIEIYEILLISFPILLLFELIHIFYGQQFYVFRGNQQDAFVYTSLGLSFFNYTHQELIEIKTNKETIINKYYLKHALDLIYYRPSVSLVISLLKGIPFSNLFFVNYIFKILCTLLTLFSVLSFFNYFKIKLKLNIIYSYVFILSFFYFYNFEIDAYSLILSLPFFILILGYSINIEKELNKFNKNLLKYIFLWTCLFIIYPNGAAIAMPPTAILIFYILFKKNFKINIFKNIIISIILFLLTILPFYKTTILYLYQEIIVGLFHDPDYWGYYGAFLFGKDNPIRDLSVVEQIKNLLFIKNSIWEIFYEILKINFEKNSNIFVLNIIPSIFGYFHFTTDKVSQFNIIFVTTLLFLNLYLIKKISSNLYYLVLSKNKFSILIKIYFIYFLFFFISLVFKGNFWSSIKLFFFISPIFYFLLVFNFLKNKIILKFNFIIILLAFLPFYKYSSFNNGIGKLDSFPSIIHPKNKTNTIWDIDREKLYNCDELIYDIQNKSEKIFISMIYNEKDTIINSSTKCKVTKKNNKFDLRELK